MLQAVTLAVVFWVKDVVNSAQDSADVDLQQRTVELLQLARDQEDWNIT